MLCKLKSSERPHNSDLRAKLQIARAGQSGEGHREVAVGTLALWEAGIWEVVTRAPKSLGCTACCEARARGRSPRVKVKRGLSDIESEHGYRSFNRRSDRCAGGGGCGAAAGAGGPGGTRADRDCDRAPAPAGGPATLLGADRSCDAQSRGL